MSIFRILVVIFAIFTICRADESKEGVIDLTPKSAGGKAHYDGFIKDYNNFEIGRMRYSMYVGTLFSKNFGNEITARKEYDSNGCPTGIWQEYSVGRKDSAPLGDYVKNETIYKDGKIYKRNTYTYHNLKGVLYEQSIYDTNYKAEMKESFGKRDSNIKLRSCRYEPEIGQLMINRRFYTNGYVEKESEIVKKDNGKFVLYKRFYKENGKLYKEGECPIEKLKEAYYECRGDYRFKFKDIDENSGRVSIKVEPPKDITYKIEPYKEMYSDNKTIKVEGFKAIIPLKIVKGENKLDVKTKKEYNEKGKLYKETDYNKYGEEIEYRDYDSNGNLTKSEIKEGGNTIIKYYENGKLTYETVNGVKRSYYDDGKIYEENGCKYARDGNVYYCSNNERVLTLVDTYGNEFKPSVTQITLKEKIVGNNIDTTINYQCNIKISDKKIYSDYIVESIKCIAAEKNERISKNYYETLDIIYTCDTSKAKENDKTHSHCYKIEERLNGSFPFQVKYDKSGNLIYIYAMENKNATDKKLNDRDRYLDSIDNYEREADFIKRKFHNNTMTAEIIYHCIKDERCDIKSTKKYTNNGKLKEEYKREKDSITNVKYAEDGNIYYKVEYVMGVIKGRYGGEDEEYVKDVKYMFAPLIENKSWVVFRRNLDDYETTFKPDTKEANLYEYTFQRKKLFEDSYQYDDAGWAVFYVATQNTYSCNVEMESGESNNESSEEDSNKDSKEAIVKSIKCTKTDSKTFNPDKVNNNE